MRARLLPILCLPLMTPATPAGAGFGGHYAIPACGAFAPCTTSTSIPVGNWTLASSSPGTVVELLRSPSDLQQNAQGFAITTSSGATASLTITAPERPYDCLALLSVSVDLRLGGAVWMLDGDGLHILADSPGLYLLDNLFPSLRPGDLLGFFVMGSSPTTLQVMTFDYLDSLPGVEIQPASAVFAVSATLNGSVRPRDYPTQAWFEYGREDFSQSTPQVAISGLECRRELTFPVQGLQPDTTYQFRVAASNGFESALSQPLTFTTARLPVITQVAVPAGGACRLEFSGTASALYSVWASTNLAHWQSLGPGSEVSPGKFRFTDSATPIPPWRFYRVSSP